MKPETVRRTDLRYRIGLNLRAVVGRSYPRIVGANREPSWIFFEALLPLLGIAAYVFIYQFFGNQAIAVITQSTATAPWGMCGKHACADAAEQAQYLAAVNANTNALVASVVLGGTMVAFWLNVLWSMASQLYWEKEIGNLQLYMMAPMNRMALLGGMAVGGMVMASMRAVSTLVAGVLVFGVIFQVASPLLLLAVFFATLVALYGLGMMFASLYLLWGREAWNLSALMEEPIFFSSGFYFPLGGLLRIPGCGPAIAIAGSFILVLMYVVFVAIGRPAGDPDAFSYMYVGNSFFIFVASVLFGTFQVIQSDREWYQTIRYVYISPISYYVYILGRAASKIAVSVFAVAITLVFGVMFLGVRLHLAFADVPLFVVSTILGLSVLLAIGICLGGISFLTAKHTHCLPECIPGLFYVFCGVLFPLSVLPDWGPAVGPAIPLTYWFDMTRPPLAPTITVNTTLGGYDPLTILLFLVVSSVGFFGLSVLIYKVRQD